MRALAALFALVLAGPATADEALVARWYAALEKADGEALAALLAPEATVTLHDLDIVQDRAEFLASMEEWADAIAGGSIRYRIEQDDERTAAVLVCYRFTGSEALVRETFGFRDGLVSGNTQAAVADDCSGF